MVNVWYLKLHKHLSLIIIDKSGLLKTDHERFILLKTYYVFNSLHLILSCSSLFDYKIPLTYRVYNLFIAMITGGESLYLRELLLRF